MLCLQSGEAAVSSRRDKLFVSALPKHPFLSKGACGGQGQRPSYPLGRRRLAPLVLPVYLLPFSDQRVVSVSLQQYICDDDGSHAIDDDAGAVGDAGVMPSVYREILLC